MYEPLDKETLRKWRELEDLLEDVIEGSKSFLQPEEMFVLHPLNLEITAEYGDDPEEEGRRKKVIIHFVFQLLRFNPEKAEVISKREEATVYATIRDGITLGYDGTDWWLSIASS